MKVILAIVLTSLFLLSVLLEQIYHSLPIKELRRRARAGGDRRAAKIYKMAAYTSSLELILWLISVLSLGGLILMVAGVAWWLTLLVLLVALFIWSSNIFRARSGWRWYIASLLAPMLSALLSLLQPAIRPIAQRLKKQPRPHTELYEKEDLLEMLGRQGAQVDNRLSAEELKIVRGALAFGGKSVSSVMTPRRKVKFVVAGDPVGPLLMDELHAVGHIRFPVVKEAPGKSAEPQVVGILYLSDVLGYSEKGKVRNVMKPEVYFINETQTLRDALAVFLKTHHHLLVVVNNFEEMAGVISLEDVLEQILGNKIIDEFDRYNDLRSVAGLEAEKSRSQHSKTTLE